MDLDCLLQEKADLEQNFNMVLDPLLVDYFIYEMCALETLLTIYVRDAKPVNSAPGLPIDRRLRWLERRGSCG